MSDADQWSYYAWLVKIPGLKELNTHLAGFGVEGWELVTSMTTVKTWVNLSGNDLVLIFKKPGLGHTISAKLEEQLTGYNPEVAY